MAKIPTIEENPKTGWSDWQSTGYKFKTVCCDCGLTHDDEYKIMDGKLIWRTRVNKRTTAAVRREKKKKNAKI